MSDRGVLVVVPAYNEEGPIAGVITNLRAAGYERVLVVDDGSTDGTVEQARQAGAMVIRHAINRGLGGGIGTGFAAAQWLKATALVTIDADGQHDPRELDALLAPVLANEADVVVGSRVRQRQEMPWYRRCANQLANCLTFMIFGKWSSDSQSGLRAFSRTAIERMEIKTSGFEVSSEVIGEVGRLGLRYTEVPIRAIYTEYSLSKGQSFGNGIRTLAHLILRRYWA
jgi:UDP-N-acetylglucosamine---dolichyl-phosphate N-acetylglucosaminyltransferase